MYQKPCTKDDPHNRFAENVMDLEYTETQLQALVWRDFLKEFKEYKQTILVQIRSRKWEDQRYSEK